MSNLVFDWKPIDKKSTNADSALFCEFERFRVSVSKSSWWVVHRSYEEGCIRVITDSVTESREQSIKEATAWINSIYDGICSMTVKPEVKR